VDIDNRLFVPHTPLLSTKYKADIIVEYFNAVKSIKYICKYVNKGREMAVLEVDKAIACIDDISQFQLGRYISSNEAVWHILSFKIHERYPTIVHLVVNIDNGQRVYFTSENAGVREPLQTTLIAFLHYA